MTRFVSLLVVVAIAAIGIVGYVIAGNFKKLQAADLAFSVLTIWNETELDVLEAPGYNDNLVGDPANLYSDVTTAMDEAIPDPFDNLGRNPGYHLFYMVTDSETLAGVAFVAYPGTYLKYPEMQEIDVLETPDFEPTETLYDFSLEVFRSPNNAYIRWVESNYEAGRVWVTNRNGKFDHSLEADVEVPGTPRVSLNSRRGEYLSKSQLESKLLGILDGFEIHESDYRMGYRKLRSQFPELSMFSVLLAFAQTTAGLLATLGGAGAALGAVFVWLRNRTHPAA